MSDESVVESFPACVVGIETIGRLLFYRVIEAWAINEDDE